MRKKGQSARDSSSAHEKSRGEEADRCGTLRAQAPGGAATVASPSRPPPSIEQVLIRLFGEDAARVSAPVADPKTLLTLIEQLPIESRSVLLMIKRDGLATAEVAKRLALSEEEVMRRFARAIAGVRRLQFP